MDRHVTIVGVLDVALGLSGLIGAFFVLISLVGGGLATGEWPAMLLLPLMGAAISVLLLILSIPTLIAGIGLLSGAKWGRAFGLFASAVNLVSFPIGTPIGAYGLWALTRPQRAA